MHQPHESVSPVWTASRVAVLKYFWERGDTASQIANVFGDMTRCAVLGKVHRIGLPSRKAPIRSLPGLKFPSKRSVKTMAAKGPQKVIAPFMHSAFECDGPRVPLQNLGDEACRWPLGDPRSVDFGFCGQNRVSRSPYCGHHAAIGKQTHNQRG